MTYIMENLEMKNLIETALTTDTLEFEEEIKEWFEYERIIKIKYCADLDGKKGLAFVYGTEAKVPIKEMSKRLSRWLTPSMYLNIHCDTDIDFDISGLSGLNVNSVNFNIKALCNNYTLLENSKIKGLWLPQYRGEIPKLENLLSNVEVKGTIVTSNLKYVNISEVGTLFPNCKFSTLNLINLDFSNISSFNETFGGITAKKLRLPKEIGNNCEEIKIKSIFKNSNIEEIENLDVFLPLIKKL